MATDLLPHREAWMGEAMADQRLGLDPTDLCSRAEKAGFTNVVFDRSDDAYVVQAPGGREVQLPLFLLAGRRPRAAVGDGDPVPAPTILSKEPYP